LKRLIQNKILDELALRILEGKIADGAAITVDAKKNELQIASA
jgi:ATP-dependent Clp protease ATP-binding subunit ClpA